MAKPDMRVVEAFHLRRHCIETIHRIECSIGNSGDTGDDLCESMPVTSEPGTTIVQFAQQLQDQGWRYSVSDTYGVEGPICPLCAANPENKVKNLPDDKISTLARNFKLMDD